MTQTEALSKCKQAADAIAALPVEKWPQWIAWILEALEGEPVKSQSGERLRVGEWFLERVEHDVHERLRVGRW